MLIWDNKLNRFITIYLNYSHLGSLDPKKHTYYTKNIITENENIIEDRDINLLIRKIQKQGIAKSNLASAFLLNSNENLYETKYLKNEKKWALIEIENKNQIEFYEKLNNNKKIELLINSIKESKEFINKNEEILEKIPLFNRVDFIHSCLNYQYKIEFFKNKDIIYLISSENSIK